jgi:hypothetical protein
MPASESSSDARIVPVGRPSSLVRACAAEDFTHIPLPVPVTGVRKIEFSLSLRPILADTEEPAWKRAEEIKTRVRAAKNRVRSVPSVAA